jgi:predicted nucleotidyltransferase
VVQKPKRKTEFKNQIIDGKKIRPGIYSSGARSVWAIVKRYAITSPGCTHSPYTNPIIIPDKDPITRKEQRIIGKATLKTGECMRNTSSPRQTEIEEIVNRIVDAAHPEQVLLFGSTARGTTGPDSDLDFLVIKAGRYNARKVAGIIYQRMRGIARSMDLVIVTPQQVKDYRDSPFSVVYPAVREGRVVYERTKTIS